MTRIQRIVLALVVLFFCTAFDQFTKDVARKKLAGAPTISLLHDTLRIQYSENPGATLGLGASLPPELRFTLFVILNGLISLTTLFYALKSTELHATQFISLLLVAAGGLGNLLDRLLHHGVAIDFLNLGIGPLRTGIFNVADILIVGGAILFMLASFHDRKEVSAA